MAEKLTVPKGTHDILPEEVSNWQYIELMARRLFECYNFQEIRTPMFEATELFSRGVGETTDIVNKEMYTFEKGERSLTLRPENTASVARAYIQHGMDRWPKPVQLYYLGPMFRYERPQAGRQRQFHQVGVEMFGADTPDADLQVISLAHIFLKHIHVGNIEIQINNLGNAASREAFKTVFLEKLQPFYSLLSEDSQKRLTANPLRILDSKDPQDLTILKNPSLQDFLEQDHTDSESQDHFQCLCEGLWELGIPYVHNKKLVRGLDYYSKTVFEIVATDGLGAQNAVCGGGRYNHLVKQLGGPDVPAVGWAMGIERLLSLAADIKPVELDFFIVSQQPHWAAKLATKLVDKFYRVDYDKAAKSLNKQMDLAAKRDAKWTLIHREGDNIELKNKFTKETQYTVLSDFISNLPNENLMRFY